MSTLEELRHRIAVTEEVASVVRTMKSLAAVKIRQYEQAVDAVSAYAQTVSLGLQALLREVPAARAGAIGAGGSAGDGGVGTVVFGSDQGMCGRFNQDIADFVGTRVTTAEVRLVCVGRRAEMEMRKRGGAAETTVPVPGSREAMTGTVQEVTGRVATWWLNEGVKRVVLFHNTYDRSSYRPRGRQLLPLDGRWLERLASRAWPSRRLPFRRTAWQELFAQLIQQHLFVTIYRACAESLAGENASRLRAMQAAERNIEERLEALRVPYQRQRQSAVTEELMDVVSGYEALGSGNPDEPAGGRE